MVLIGDIEGLSPRARGKQYALAECERDVRSIPASAGETSTTATWSTSMRVYPRERGGNGVAEIPRIAGRGLSPRARGKPFCLSPSVRSVRSIPASAGETGSKCRTRALCAVYPRERGGNSSPKSERTTDGGLSPRARGKLETHRDLSRRRGSIPASAGETYFSVSSRSFLRVYPRERGGNFESIDCGRDARGLSPRARGKPSAGSCVVVSGGSIPASAGETLQQRHAVLADQVYPRERGGNATTTTPRDPEAGLSPRARGKHLDGSELSQPGRSIPASAGETCVCHVFSSIRAVYPRERGGNCWRPLLCLPLGGLSPRARGKRVPSRARGKHGRSIPASAGETIEAVVRDRHRKVYPRERGGNQRLGRPSKPEEVYPRERGGNAGARYRARHLYGLSPRARGKPRRCT